MKYPMSLRPDETELRGAWELSNGKMAENDVLHRIRRLTGEYLQHIAASKDGWRQLYQDPEDLRFWELSYPQSQMHGGGPQLLQAVTQEYAIAEFDFLPSNDGG